MDASDGSEHPLLHMELGVIRHLYNFLNPRPPVAAGAVLATQITLRPPHPILTNAQLRLNCVLARRTPENQEAGSFARVSSLMYDVDVHSGRALFSALMQNRSDATVCDLIDMNPVALTMIDTQEAEFPSRAAHGPDKQGRGHVHKGQRRLPLDEGDTS